MTGSVMGRRGRRTVISQLLETLRGRLFAIAQAEMLFNSVGMVCELEVGKPSHAVILVKRFLYSSRVSLTMTASSIPV